MLERHQWNKDERKKGEGEHHQKRHLLRERPGTLGKSLEQQASVFIVQAHGFGLVSVLESPASTSSRPVAFACWNIVEPMHVYANTLDTHGGCLSRLAE
jgi:hypothetical protein